MKKVLLATLILLGLATASLAASTTPGVFVVSATIPSATDITYITSKVQNGPPITFTEVARGSAGTLAWGTTDLTYDTVNGIWLGKHFYAIDVAPTIGVGGAPAAGNFGTVSFSFTGETVPAGQTAGDGLSKRAVLTAVKVAGTTETNLRGPARLGAVGSLASITGSDVSGGFLRVYVGLYTGLPAVVGAVPPTNGDKPGVYGGTLTITATLI